MVKNIFIFIGIILLSSIICSFFPQFIVALIIGGICLGFFFFVRSGNRFTKIESGAWHNLGCLVGGLLRLNPVLTDKQKKLLLQFRKAFTHCFDYYEMIDRCMDENSQTDTEIDYATINEYLPLAKRRDFVIMLFKLAAEDDGIKNDEWLYIHRVIGGMKLSGRTVDYLQRRYGPLRTEYDYEETKTEQQQASAASNYQLVDSFATLGLAADATMEQVQVAYRSLAMQYHPDLPKNAENHKECVEKMAAINVAYKKIMGR